MVLTDLAGSIPASGTGVTQDFEPTDSQKAILSQLAEETRKREESLDLIVTEGSNDSLLT